MDTRLINQVVEWEWKIQLDNEKKNNYHPGTYRSYTAALECCGKVVKSIATQIINLHRSSFLSIHNSEPA